MMVGGQTGAAVGGLAREVVSSTDVGLPLGPEGVAALLPAGVADFGQGLSISAEEIRIFLALREAAHHRLFAHVPWLRSRLLAAVEDYARGITVDASALRDAMPQIDPSNPDALREALSDASMFQPEDTPQQKAALARLETLLALVEGWVATVVEDAAAERLPQAGALAEAIRRRRATGGPAERTFATLVGLELRPRRLREAAEIWRRLTDVRGSEGRDALWAHPDLMPTAEDFDDPEGFVAGRRATVRAGHVRAGRGADGAGQGNRRGRGRPVAPARRGDGPSGATGDGPLVSLARKTGRGSRDRKAPHRSGNAAARVTRLTRQRRWRAEAVPARRRAESLLSTGGARRLGCSGRSERLVIREFTAVPRCVHRNTPPRPQGWRLPDPVQSMRHSSTKCTGSRNQAGVRARAAQECRPAVAGSRT